MSASCQPVSVMREVTMLILLFLSGQALAADFFTGMDNHIGCFYDQPQDRWSRGGRYIITVTNRQPSK